MKRFGAYRNLRIVAEAAGCALFFLSIAAALFEWLHLPFSLLFTGLFLLLGAEGNRMVQEFSKKVWQYLLGWLLVSGVVCGAAFLTSSVWSALLIGVQCVVQFFIRMLPHLKEYVHLGWVRVAIMAGLFVLTAASAAESLSVILACTVGYLLLKYLSDSLDNTETFIDDMREVAFMPSQQIRTVNGGILVVYLGITAGIMLLFSALPLGGAANQLGQGVLAVIRWLISLLPGTGSDEDQFDFVDSEIGSSDSETGEIVAGQHWILQLLEKIVVTLVVIAAVAAVIFLIGALVYRLYKGFYQTAEGRTEEREFVLPFVKEEKIAARRESVRSRWGRDPASKIRRMYRKKIRGKLPKNAEVPQGSTPEEQIRLAHLQEKEQAGAFRYFYEKARYGKEVTEADAEEMRAVSGKV